MARLTALGHRVVVDPTLHDALAAVLGDRRRAARRGRRAWRTIRGVELAIAVRGGYGWSRLLDRIDFAALAATRKRWLGHSDFTAFQLAALAHAGMTTFAGPMAAVRFRRRDAVGVHARPLLGPARQRPLRGRVRARRPRLRRRGHAVGRQPGDGRASRRHAALAARRRRHPVPRGHRRASVPDRADALPAALRRRARAAARGAARRVQRLRARRRTTTATTPRRWSRTSARRSACTSTPGCRSATCRDKLTLPVGGHCALTVRDGRARLVFSDYGRAARARRRACCDRVDARSERRLRRWRLPAGSKLRSTKRALPSRAIVEHGRAARAVVGADDERRRQQPLPFERDAGRRQRASGARSVSAQEREQRRRDRRRRRRRAPAASAAFVRTTLGQGVSSR